MSLSLAADLHIPSGISTGDSTPEVDVCRVLSQLCDLAGYSIDGVEAAAVVLLRHGVPVLQSSNGFARAVDRIQYGTGDGPCVEAAAQGHTVVSGRLGTGEPRWPQFVAATRSLAVESVLSLPLTAEQQVIGSINLYSRQRHAFDDQAVAAGEQFARPAAASLFAAWSPAETDAVGAGDAADTGAELPVDLVHGIEAVVAGLGNSALRSAIISRMAEEMYQTLAWALVGGSRQAELCSFAQVLAAAYAHEDRVTALSDSGEVR